MPFHNPSIASFVNYNTNIAVFERVFCFNQTIRSNLCFMFLAYQGDKREEIDDYNIVITIVPLRVCTSS